MTGRPLWLGFVLFFTASSIYAEIPQQEDVDLVEKRFAEAADDWVAFTKDQAQRAASAFVKYLKEKPQRFDRAFLEAFLGMSPVTNKDTDYWWFKKRNEPVWDERVAMAVAEMKQWMDIFIEDYFRPKEEWAQSEAQAKQLREMMLQGLRQLYAGLEQEPFVRMYHEVAHKEYANPPDSGFSPFHTMIGEQARYFASRLEALERMSAGDKFMGPFHNEFRYLLTENDMKRLMDEWQAELDRWARIKELIPVWKAGVEEIQKEQDVEKRIERYETFLGGGFIEKLSPNRLEGSDLERYCWGMLPYFHTDGKTYFVYYIIEGPSIWKFMEAFWAVPESQEMKDARKAIKERQAREMEEQDARDKKDRKEDR